MWEKLENSSFNYGEFATIKSEAGLNSYKISVKEWVKKTNAIGIFSKPGRYGGTYPQRLTLWHIYNERQQAEKKGKASVTYWMLICELF